MSTKSVIYTLKPCLMGAGLIQMPLYAKKVKQKFVINPNQSNKLESQINKILMCMENLQI